MLGQIISIIAMILMITSFQMKTRKQIIILQTMGSGLFMISYLFLESWSAVYLNGIFLIRNIIFYFSDEQKWARHKAWLPIFSCAVVAAGLAGFRSWWDLLPIAGSVIGTVGMYMASENTLRALKLCESPCWLVYNCTVPSTGGIICEACNIVSIVVGLIRFRKKGGKQSQTDHK